jgi:hypothetical protein
LENALRLNDDVSEQAHRRCDLLNTALDFATKISEARSVLNTNLRDAREMLTQFVSSSKASDTFGLSKRQDDLQVR